MRTTPTIVMLGAFDTKGAEYSYARERLLSLGAQVMSINFGVGAATPDFPIDIGADDVAAAAGADLSAIRASADRGQAMDVMSRGAATLVSRLYDKGGVDGVFGMGGSGGSSVITAAMRALPLGLPKVCLSTIAGGDTAAYVGAKDIVLYPSIADIAGLNRLTRCGIDGAVGAVIGMATSRPVSASDRSQDRPMVVASMFGNTTQCVDSCRAELDIAGYEVLVFHATGAGGRAMESLLDEGLIVGSLDLTTTELADTLCGGVFDAGPDRLKAAGRRGVPQLVAPGSLDMVNFGPMSSVPDRYREAGRNFYRWNPAVTLMRTSPDENRQLGRQVAERLNEATGPVAVLIPTRGFSVLGGSGGPFEDPAADAAFVESLRGALSSRIECRLIDANINDAAFARQAASGFLDLIQAAAAAK